MVLKGKLPNSTMLEEERYGGIAKWNTLSKLNWYGFILKIYLGLFFEIFL